MNGNRILHPKYFVGLRMKSQYFNVYSLRFMRCAGYASGKLMKKNNFWFICVDSVYQGEKRSA